MHGGLAHPEYACGFSNRCAVLNNILRFKNNPIVSSFIQNFNLLPLRYETKRGYMQTKFELYDIFNIVICPNGRYLLASERLEFIYVKNKISRQTPTYFSSYFRE